MVMQGVTEIQHTQLILFLHDSYDHDWECGLASEVDMVVEGMAGVSLCLPIAFDSFRKAQTDVKAQIDTGIHEIICGGFSFM